MDRQRTTTLLTVAIVVLWIVSAVVRIWVDWPVASVLDAAMPAVVGYWFVANSAKRNGNGKEASPV